MACPTCDHTMEVIIGFNDSHPVFWCPRCGTISNTSRSGDKVRSNYVPVLVERCRTLAGGLTRPPRPEHTAFQVWDGLRNLWHRLGIAESINTPQNRKETPC